MDLMADAVAGPGEIYAMLGGDRLQIAVVIAVFKAALESIVVNIGDTQLGLDSGNTHCLKFQISHSAGGILGQGLVDPQSYF